MTRPFDETRLSHFRHSHRARLKSTARLHARAPLLNRIRLVTHVRLLMLFRGRASRRLPTELASEPWYDRRERMIEPRPSAVVLAAAIVAAETSGVDGESGRSTATEEVVMTKLRANLGKLIGPKGFDVLLERALALAKKREPLLLKVTVDAGGALRGLEDQPSEVKQAFVVVLSHLLELLIRFINEDLAARIVRDVWPNVDRFKEKKG